MTVLLFGIALAAFSAFGMWDAYRILSSVREPGKFDPVGPDHYMLGIAAILLMLALCLIVQGLRAASATSAPADDSGIDISDAGAQRSHVWLLAAVCGYVIAMPVAGYGVATLIFFFAALQIMGMRGWIRNATVSLLLTGLFFAAFVVGADMPLPRGWPGWP